MFNKSLILTFSFLTIFTMSLQSQAQVIEHHREESLMAQTTMQLREKQVALAGLQSEATAIQEKLKSLEFEKAKLTSSIPSPTNPFPTEQRISYAAPKARLDLVSKEILQLKSRAVHVGTEIAEHTSSVKALNFTVKGMLSSYKATSFGSEKKIIADLIEKAMAGEKISNLRQIVKESGKLGKKSIVATVFVLATGAALASNSETETIHYSTPQVSNAGAGDSFDEGSAR